LSFTQWLIDLDHYLKWHSERFNQFEALSSRYTIIYKSEANLDFKTKLGDPKLEDDEQVTSSAH